MTQHNTPPKDQREDLTALRARYTKAQDEMKQVYKLITTRLDRLDAEEADRMALKRKVQETAVTASKKVKLDVGGKIFCIARSQLIDTRARFLQAMVESDEWEPDSDGAYFIDRSPKHFDRVLNYVRFGKMSYAGLRQDEIETLQETLEFLQLFPDAQPVACDLGVTWDPDTCVDGLHISQGNRAITSTGPTRSVRSLSPCVKFSVRLDATGRHACVMVGFTPEVGFTPHGHAYIYCGWYLYLHDGKLYSSGNTYRHFRAPVTEGSVVTCVFSRESNSISFQVDGEPSQVAYTNVPNVEAYAALCFLRKNIQLSLVD